MNKHNLQRMYNHIYNVPEALLDMRNFRDRRNYIMHTPLAHECNTVGCVLGHSLILDKFENIPNNGRTIYFQEWSYRFLDFRDSTLWLFMFGGQWADNAGTNTKTQILLRLQYIIDHGKCPIAFIINRTFEQYNFNLILSNELRKPEK